MQLGEVGGEGGDGGVVVVVVGGGGDDLAGQDERLRCLRLIGSLTVIVIRCHPVMSSTTDDDVTDQAT